MHSQELAFFFGFRQRGDQFGDPPELATLAQTTRSDGHYDFQSVTFATVSDSADC